MEQTVAAADGEADGFVERKCTEEDIEAVEVEIWPALRRPLEDCRLVDSVDRHSSAVAIVGADYGQEACWWEHLDALYAPSTSVAIWAEGCHDDGEKYHSAWAEMRMASLLTSETVVRVEVVHVEVSWPAEVVTARDVAYRPYRRRRHHHLRLPCL